MTITTPNGFKIGPSTTKLYAIKVDTLSVERPVVQVYKDDCNTLSSLWPPYMWKKTILFGQKHLCAIHNIKARKLCRRQG